MKRIIMGVITGCMALAMATGAVSYKAEANAAHRAYFVIGQKSYNVDGQSKTMDAASFIENGRTYVPVRYLGYALGVSDTDVQWSNPTATLAMGDTVVKLSLKSKQYQVNNEQKTMDVVPIEKSGRIYLPARFVAEAFDYEVGWDDTAQAVLIGPKGQLPAAPKPSVPEFVSQGKLGDKFVGDKSNPLVKRQEEGLFEITEQLPHKVGSNTIQQISVIKREGGWDYLDIKQSQPDGWAVDVYLANNGVIFRHVDGATLGPDGFPIPHDSSNFVHRHYMYPGDLGKATHIILNTINDAGQNEFLALPNPLKGGLKQ